MDFVLDSRSPWVDYTEEVLIEIAVRSGAHASRRSLTEYVFAIGHEQNLHDYWNEQAILWAKVGGGSTIDSPNNEGTRFPDSYERYQS